MPKNQNVWRARKEEKRVLDAHKGVLSVKKLTNKAFKKASKRLRMMRLGGGFTRAQRNAQARRGEDG